MITRVTGSAADAVAERGEPPVKSTSSPSIPPLTKVRSSRSSSPTFLRTSTRPAWTRKASSRGMSPSRKITSPARKVRVWTLPGLRFMALDPPIISGRRIEYRREPMRLAGKVALVTGAQQGIGRAIALAMAGEGADVGLNFLDDPGAAERVAGEIRGRGRKVLTVKGDVAQARDVQALVDAVTGGLGPPRLLGNNAGGFPRPPVFWLTQAEWEHVLGVTPPGDVPLP